MTSRRSLMTWGRSDQIGAELVALLVGVLAAGALLVSTWDALRRVPITLSVRVLESRAGVLGPGTSAPYSGTVVLDEPSTGEAWLHAAPQMVGTAAVVAGAVLLFRLLRSMSRGDPSERPNARRLMTLALLVTAGGLFVDGATDVANSVLIASQPDVDDVGFETTLSFVWVGAGLLIAFLSEIFRRGTAMRDDLAGLI